MLNDLSYVHGVVTQGEPYASHIAEQSYVMSYQVLYAQDGLDWITATGQDLIVTVRYTLNHWGLDYNQKIFKHCH
jgi:hypothetical protein